MRIVVPKAEDDEFNIVNLAFLNSAITWNWF
jgi:hypothetical protein